MKKRNGLKEICIAYTSDDAALHTCGAKGLIGGAAPSDYLAKLEKGSEKTPPIKPENLDVYLGSHLVNPTLLRANDFHAFMADRQKRLLALIEKATGRSVYIGDLQEEGEDIEADEDGQEAELTIGGAPVEV